MRSSTSNSDNAFFGRAALFLGVMLGVALAVGHVVGRAYRPQSLSPNAAALAASDHYVMLLGNSRFEAGIDPSRLASRLGENVRAQKLNGGGWDALHYYMLALLARDTLRPGRDLAIIEISPASLNDAEPANRLGTLRPEVARELAALPGEPIETRLDILCGAVAGLYRYRNSIQAIAIAPRLERAARRLESPLARLLGPPRLPAAYRLVLAPDRDFVIDHIEGDRAAVLSASRRRAEATMPALRVGGFKLEALRGAVHALRSRGIDVFLVQTPVSDWLDTLTAHMPGVVDFRRDVEALAKSEGARLAWSWPSPLHAEERFWDDQHMVVSASDDFTDTLAAQIRADFRW